MIVCGLRNSARGGLGAYQNNLALTLSRSTRFTWFIGAPQTLSKTESQSILALGTYFHLNQQFVVTFEE